MAGNEALAERRILEAVFRMRAGARIRSGNQERLSHSEEQNAITPKLRQLPH
jgi:hypothetical protein